MPLELPQPTGRNQLDKYSIILVLSQCDGTIKWFACVFHKKLLHHLPKLSFHKPNPFFQFRQPRGGVSICSRDAEVVA